MAIFITGATGYLGSYVVAGLLEQHDDRLALLVRAGSHEEAARRLWKSLQLHMPFEPFLEQLRSKVDIYLGDITRPRLGLDDAAFERLVETSDSIVHIAASLNRRSERVCLDVNQRGTLQVVKLARAIQDSHGLRRFSDVSTSAVAGERKNEVVQEDAAIDWKRRDYDPYARTKKFCEHMIHELLPDVPTTVFRPTIVMGDSRFAETTQFDMVRAYAGLARARVIPLRPEYRQDIVSADYVGKAIVHVHQLAEPRHGIYHLSAGEASPTNLALMEALRLHGKPVAHRFAPGLERPFGSLMDSLSRSPRSWGLSGPASLMKVFWPYITFDTVFDNSRIVQELGEAPVPFVRFVSRLLDFAVDGGFSYPHAPWPDGVVAAEVSSSAA